MGTLFFTQRLLVFLLCFLLHLNPSLPYSLKNCSIDYSEDASAEVSLDCSYHKLVSVPGDIPRDVSLLKLYFNQPVHIKKDDFANLSKLKVLLLNNNQIAHVDDGSFIHLVALIKLAMDHNKLTNLTNNLFQGLSNLTVLDLSYNNIHFIHESAFHFMTSLKIVVLDENNLRHIADLRPILQLPHIQSLNITSNLFSSFETKDLQLNVSSGLKMLDVSYNRFEKFSITTPVFPHLEEIHIENVQSSGIKWDIPDKTLLRSITQLYLSNNVIHFKEPKKVLQSLDSLTHLGLRYMKNSINSDSDSDSTLFINKEFQFNTQLKSLSIIQIDLSDLGPELFELIPNLQALNLSQTKLRSLDFLANANLSELRRLKLSDNEITAINETVFQSLPALTYLELDNNPFTCDCSNAGFIQWVKSNNQTQVADGHQYTCAFPPSKQGNKLLDFDIQSCWINVSFFCFICSTSLTLLTLLTSFIYHFLRWQLAYTFYLSLAFLYNSRRKKKAAPHQYDAFISYNVHDEAWVYRVASSAGRGAGLETLPAPQRLPTSFCLFDEQKDVLILLFLEEIPARQLSPYYRMRKPVKRRTYLTRPQAGQHPGVFWQNDDAPSETDVLTGPAGC
ncbi:hypothetical protein L3Q82_003258 [Scortum barcoo]|uniref:Uncharacterized protein n=1 Tax=Scortum barcoo TaxID=214431 RepID=A0ACB8VS53_9TELE|nr:hypothetical protein L3Q82_003258 [Scortum barcoo]